MPPKRKANATKKGDASESTARRSSPNPPADSASAHSPERQPGVADTVSEKPASGAGAAMNNEDAAVGTAGVPDYSQVMKRKPGRVAKRGRVAANAPKDPVEQTPEIPDRSEPAGADVDGPTVTTEPPVKTAGKRGAAALGPPAKRAAAANASEPGQEFATPRHSKTSDGDATDGPTVTAEQRPVKAGKRGRAAARQVAEPRALSAHGQGAAVDVSKAKEESNAVSPVRSPSTHSEPPAAPAEDGERAGTSKTGGKKRAAKRGRPAKSIAATAVPQQQVHDMSAEPPSQVLATHDQQADIHEEKTEGERTSGSPVHSLPIHSKTAGGLEAGQSTGTSNSTAGKRGRPAKSKAATAAQQQQVHDDLPAEPQLEQRAPEGQHTVVNVGKAKGGRKSGGPVGSPLPDSNPTSVHAKAGGSAGTSKSTGKQAAKRGHPAKSKAATAAPQQQVNDDPPAEQQLATEGQHAEVTVGKSKGGKNSESLVQSPSPHKPANAHADAGRSAGTSKSTGKQAANRGRPAKGKAAAALQQQDHHELPADASNPGEDSESQNPSLPKKKSLGLSKQRVLMTNGNTDVSDVAAKNSLAKGTKRGRASGTIEAATSESRELGEQGPPAKRATVSASSFYGTTSRTTAQGAKRAGRSAKQPAPAAVPSTSSPGTAAATDGHSGRVAKKASAKAQPAAAKGPGKQNKKRPAKGKMAASNGTEKQKKVAKGRQQPKSKQGKRKDADDLSDVSDSSYVVPRGLLQRAKRREPFYYDYIVPWVESQLPSESDDEDDFSTASLSSIIPPAGMLQPYRPKNRLIGAGGSGSSSEDDMSVSPGEDLLSRCEAKFGVGTLPHSTTTTAEAISMLVNFASSRHLPFRDLAELVTIANKLFAPAKDVLPTGKALANALSEMP